MDGRDVDVDALMLWLEHEYQQGGIKRCQNNRTNAWLNEVKTTFKGNEFLGSG